MPFCQVIVDINHTDVDHVFTYRVPAGLDVCPGMRVHVPFGPRKLEGVVVEMAADCDLPPERVKDICDTLEDYPAVLPPLLELAKEIQRTSFCTLAVALRLMFPAQMRGQRIREKQQEVAVLTVAPDVLGQVIAAQVRAPKRAKVLRALADAPDMELTTAALRETVGDCRDALNALCRMGFVKLEKRESLRRPYGEMERLSAQDPELTRQQEDVLAELLPAVETGKGEFLLYGVTGSGKTEVFIRAVRRAAQMGKTAIVLVPEIALTPQMVSWFRSRFGEDAAVLHSRLSPGERYDEWRRIRRGDVRVVIGARSAIFAPLQNVGLIIIDEEHEQSYIADNNPHYDARRLAHERCAREGAALLLASATPSMRSFAMAGRGDLRLLEMPRRVNNRPMPTVHVVDMREELKKGNRSVFSGALSLGREAVSGYQLFSANAVAAGDWIRENTDRDDVFLTGQQHINPVCSLAGRQIICGSDLYVFFHGLDYSQQSADCRRFYEDPRENADVLETYNVHYIYVSDYERAEFDVDLYALDEAYELIYANDDVRIYDAGWRETP